MKTLSFFCVLLLVGCATTEVPTRVPPQRNSFAPLQGMPAVTPTFADSNVVRIVDSRMIQQVLSQSRDGNLSLSGGKRATCYVAGIVGFLYVMYVQLDEDEPVPCELGQILCI